MTLCGSTSSSLKHTSRSKAPERNTHRRHRPHRHTPGEVVERPAIPNRSPPRYLEECCTDPVVDGGECQSNLRNIGRAVRWLSIRRSRIRQKRMRDGRCLWKTNGCLRCRWRRRRLESDRDRSGRTREWNRHRSRAMPSRWFRSRRPRRRPPHRSRPVRDPWDRGNRSHRTAISLGCNRPRDPSRFVFRDRHPLRWHTRNIPNPT
mmetsp:Transcript_32126/g.61420  ORF Transcript_32126/g.61420 Transcript_32126/m.61420 type:complete len:205 (+) Transcript_32126:173-787(+)